MLVEYFLSRIFGREFDSPHLHPVRKFTFLIFYQVRTLSSIDQNFRTPDFLTGSTAEQHKDNN